MNTQIALIEDANVMLALENSLYPGAKKESIQLVLAYCAAAKIDPLLKPVHIVPMSVKNNKTDKYEWRDVIMPGIGLYRILATRTKAYLGISEPEFGEDIMETIGNKTVTYPKWCKVTVKRLINGEVAEFVAKEIWKENFATAGKDNPSPNAMWSKRPYAQLAKCTEAQALRKAFPDILSHQPTAEEMEGKTLEGEYEVLDASGEITKQKSPAQTLKEKFKVKNAKPEILEPAEQAQTLISISEETKKHLSSLIENSGLTEEEKEKWFSKLKISSLDELSEERAQKLCQKIINKQVTEDEKTNAEGKNND